ncbi:hypothetical protein [Candidatus Lokiarchaeum ossiferum]|uniref:hypothetical protein n=1 Tax=Candidatus Lokiarchaeum ossiferum TaxID=2951803 RepID=UPI00352E84BF
MKTSYLDRISRLITLIFSITGAIASIFLFINIQKGWEIALSEIIIWASILSYSFAFLGWFFIRAEHGLTPKKKKPLYNTSFWALWICGICFLFEFFLPGAFMISIALIMGVYPFFIILMGQPKVVPHIKPHKLVSSYTRATFYNYIIDAFKALAILVTIVAIIYNGSVVLFPETQTINSTEWIRNLAITIIFAGIGMEIVTLIQDKFYGLLVLIVLYILCIVQYILLNTLHFEYWWIAAPLNGLIIAGIYFFIEQKIYKSDNVGVMPGSFYMLILCIIILAILLRTDTEIDRMLENTKLIASLVGIAYIIGYIREAPKQKSLRISV